MTRTAPQLADRLRASVGFHVRRPDRDAAKTAPAAPPPADRGAHEPDAGEEFARRLRRALEV